MPGPAWAPTGRGGSVAAHRRGEAGGSLPARGGRERTCPVSPQAPRALSASPPPQPGHGKEGRGGGRGERTLGFPQPPGGGTGTRGVPPAAFSARRGLLSPSGSASSAPRAWHPRGASSLLPTRCSLSLSGSADSRGSATPSHAQARGAPHSRLGGSVALPRLPARPPRGATFPRQLPRFPASFPMTQGSGFLDGASLPPPGSACPLASSFTALSKTSVTPPGSASAPSPLLSQQPLPLLSSLVPCSPTGQHRPHCPECAWRLLEWSRRGL